MARFGREKTDLLEENQIDSGIDSLRSLTKDDQYGTTSIPDTTRREEQDKLSGGTDERIDSAYGSSSLTWADDDGLNESINKCTISESPCAENANDSENIEEEVTLLTITADGDTILHLAIIHEWEGLAHQLVALLPNEVLDIQNDLAQTALHLAVYLNLVSVVSALVARGASLKLQDQDGNTPLHMACEHGMLECATAMIHNVSAAELTHVFDTQNWRGLTCLHVATLHRQHRLMKLLIKKGANINIQEGTSGKTALHMAVELHDVDMVNLLLKKGANVDAAMLNGCTPLHLAVGRQDATITTHLCQAGADRMIRNMEDETALDLADGNDDILALFPFDDIQIMGRTIGVNF